MNKINSMSEVNKFICVIGDRIISKINEYYLYESNEVRKRIAEKCIKDFVNDFVLSTSDVNLSLLECASNNTKEDTYSFFYKQLYTYVSDNVTKRK